MASLLLLAALVGGLPAASPLSTPAVSSTVEIRSPIPVARPRLIPGYPARTLLKTEYNGVVYSVWGWTDTENVVHWLASENPHVPYTPSVQNYGIDLGELHRNTIGGTLTTNDPAFGAAWNGVRLNDAGMASGHTDHPIDAPCPGPGPCPNPRPNPDPGPDPGPAPPPPPPPPGPDLQRWVIPAGMVAVAIGVFLYALTRKAAADVS